MSATRVVRNSVHSGKNHIPTADGNAALCGAKPSTPFGWPVYGVRSEFERVCPERICKRCQAAEAKASATTALRGDER